MTKTRDFWQIEGTWPVAARQARESAPPRKETPRRERPGTRVAVAVHFGAEPPGRPSPLVFLE